MPFPTIDSHDDSSSRVSNTASVNGLASGLFGNLGAIDVAIVVSFFIYAAIFIFKSSFIIDGIRYFSLFDDDMISMRYAANLAHGHGLVWNPGGERVLG